MQVERKYLFSARPEHATTYTPLEIKSGQEKRREKRKKLVKKFGKLK